MIEGPNNYVFEDNLTPYSPKEGLQAMNFAHCTHIILAIGKYANTSRREDFSGGWEVTWEYISTEESFFGEGNLSWMGGWVFRNY